MNKNSIFISVLFVLIAFHSEQTAEANSPNCRPPRRPSKALDCDSSCTPVKSTNQKQGIYTAHVVKQWPHDERAFTQGLEFHKNCKKCEYTLYESTGLYGNSTVREVNASNGDSIRYKSLPKNEFGEGLTILGERLYQLTWRNNTIYSYNLNDFNDYKVEKTPLTDGWGMTNDGKHLFISDSTDEIAVIDPKDFQIVRKISVKYNGLPVKWVNEMEWINGSLYGNIFTRDCIAEIDPCTGHVKSWILLDRVRQFVTQEQNQINGTGEFQPEVSNGIAWNPTLRDNIVITGKFWPSLYTISLRSPSPEEVAIPIKELCMVP